MIVVAAALRNCEGRILLQQRSPGRAMAGLWEFPGGKVEKGERLDTALARELAEELGIRVDPGDLVPATFTSADNEGRLMLLLLYTCTRWTGQAKALDAAALQWLKPEEMSAWPMPPADVPLVDWLIRQG